MSQLNHPNLEDYARQLDSGERDYWSGAAMPATLGPVGWYVIRPWTDAPFVKRCYATSYLCQMVGPFDTFDQAYDTISQEIQ